MDPVIASIIIVLSKYAIDKGVELAKETGPKAVKVAELLFEKVADRFSKNPADAENMKRFEEKPNIYQAPVADALENYMKDPNFSSQIKQLLAQYQEAASTGPSRTIITQMANDNAVQIGQVSGGALTISREDSEKTE